MLYNLSNPYDCERIKIRLQSLVDKRAACVELTERTKRSNSQNRYMHVCIGIVAMETGNSLDYCKTNYFKRKCNADLFVVDKYDEVLKENIKIVRSSASLTKEEMTTAIERFRNWAATEGWYIPSPEEEFLIRQAEVEISKNKEYI